LFLFIFILVKNTYFILFFTLGACGGNKKPTLHDTVQNLCYGYTRHIALTIDFFEGQSPAEIKKILLHDDHHGQYAFRLVTLCGACREDEKKANKLIEQYGMLTNKMNSMLVVNDALTISNIQDAKKILLKMDKIVAELNKLPVKE
jgi:hypothetical protein